MYDTRCTIGEKLVWDAGSLDVVSGAELLMCSCI